MPRCPLTNFPALTYFFKRPLTVCSFSSPHNKTTSLVEKTVLGDLNKTSKYSPLTGLLSIYRLKSTLKVSSGTLYATICLNTSRCAGSYDSVHLALSKPQILSGVLKPSLYKGCVYINSVFVLY